MHNIFLIARREYIEQIHGRAFLSSTILVPLLISALVGWSAMTGGKAHDGSHVVIAASDPALAAQVRREMLYDTSAKLTVDILAPVTAEDRAALHKRLSSKSIDGVLDLDTAANGAVSASYVTISAGGFANIGGMQNYLNRALVHQRLIASQIDPAQVDSILKWVPVEPMQLGKNGTPDKSGNGTAQFFKAFLMALLISMPILLYGMNMARAIIEEKTSRIFEVMLAIAAPDELLAGKLIGVGAVGLTQITIWVTAAGLITGSALAAPMLSGNIEVHFSLAEALLFPLYFLLGFALFSALFSGLAATCETSQDLQMFTPLAAIPVWISFGILPVLMKDPSSIWAVAASLFPFTAPYVMIPRISIGAVPAWQVVVSITIMIFSIWGMLWFSSRLYRVGILMYGKRATIPELLRWLRYS
ncbi:MAG: ABC transporter permease [Terracidiphilus sp.]|jgi:ABC-2 type transport system permease protein